MLASPLPYDPEWIKRFLIQVKKKTRSNRIGAAKTKRLITDKARNLNLSLKLGITMNGMISKGKYESLIERPSPEIMLKISMVLKSNRFSSDLATFKIIIIRSNTGIGSRSSGVSLPTMS